MTEPFTLSWEEMVAIYEHYVDYGPDTDEDVKLFERLQNELQPRNVVEG